MPFFSCSRLTVNESSKERSEGLCKAHVFAADEEVDLASIDVASLECFDFKGLLLLAGGKPRMARPPSRAFSCSAKYGGSGD